MATAFDATSLATYSTNHPPYGGGAGALAIVKIHVSMPVIAAALGTISGGASDTLKIWSIPCGTLIERVLVHPTTAEGATCTITIGDGDSAAAYLASSSINATTIVGSIGTDAYVAYGGRLYLNDDSYLTITFGTDTDVDTAVFDVYVYCWFNTDLLEHA